MLRVLHSYEVCLYFDAVVPKKTPLNLIFFQCLDFFSVAAVAMRDNYVAIVCFYFFAIQVLKLCFYYHNQNLLRILLLFPLFLCVVNSLHLSFFYIFCNCYSQLIVFKVNIAVCHRQHYYPYCPCTYFCDSFFSNFIYFIQYYDYNETIWFRFLSLYWHLFNVLFVVCVVVRDSVILTLISDWDIMIKVIVFICSVFLSMLFLFFCISVTTISDVYYFVIIFI